MILIRTYTYNRVGEDGSDICLDTPTSLRKLRLDKTYILNWSNIWKRHTSFY